VIKVNAVPCLTYRFLFDYGEVPGLQSIAIVKKGTEKIMAGRGRGRGMTLPAWMTAGTTAGEVTICCLLISFQAIADCVIVYLGLNRFSGSRSGTSTFFAPCFEKAITSRTRRCSIFTT
jgi:hypothetical protein